MFFVRNGILRGTDMKSTKKRTKRVRKCTLGCGNTNATTNLFSLPSTTRKRMGNEETIIANELQRYE